MVALFFISIRRHPGELLTMSARAMLIDDGLTKGGGVRFSFSFGARMWWNSKLERRVRGSSLVVYNIVKLVVIYW